MNESLMDDYDKLKQELKDSQPDFTKAPTTEHGTIDIEYMPTICTLCYKLLAQTYMRKGDLGTTPIYILCGDCIKVFPEIVQERLKNRYGKA